MKFSCQPEDQFILIGIAKELKLSTRQVAGGVIHTYKLIEGGTQLELMHITSVQDVPSAIVGFQGRVAIGVGKLLRIYDLGKKKLLRKCENKVSSKSIFEQSKEFLF